MTALLKALVAAKQNTPEIIGELHSIYRHGASLNRHQKFLAINEALALSKELLAAVQAAHDEIVSPVKEVA